MKEKGLGWIGKGQPVKGVEHAGKEASEANRKLGGWKDRSAGV